MTEHEHTYRVYGLEGRESVRCACGDVISEPASVARMAAEHWSSLNIAKDIAPICFRHHLYRDNGPWPCVCRRDPRIELLPESYSYSVDMVANTHLWSRWRDGDALQDELRELFQDFARLAEVEVVQYVSGSAGKLRWSTPTPRYELGPGAVGELVAEIAAVYRRHAKTEIPAPWTLTERRWPRVVRRWENKHR